MNPTIPKSKRRIGTPGAHTLPQTWHPKQRTIIRLADELGKTPGDLTKLYLCGFIETATERGYQYRKWDVAFSNCVRNDWLQIRSVPEASEA